MPPLFCGTLKSDAPSRSYRLDGLVRGEGKTAVVVGSVRRFEGGVRVCLDSRSAAAKAARLSVKELDDGAAELSLWRASGCLGCDSRSEAARAAADDSRRAAVDDGTAELSLWRAS